MSDLIEAIAVNDNDDGMQSLLNGVLRLHQKVTNGRKLFIIFNKRYDRKMFIFCKFCVVILNMIEMLLFCCIVWTTVLNAVSFSYWLSFQNSFSWRKIMLNLLPLVKSMWLFFAVSFLLVEKLFSCDIGILLLNSLLYIYCCQQKKC